MKMRCWMCAEARRFTAESVYCVLYGIIITRNHECEREGARLRGTDDDYHRDSEDKTGLPEDGGSLAGTVPGILYESREQTEISGVEGNQWKNGSLCTHC